MSMSLEEMQTMGLGIRGRPEDGVASTCSVSVFFLGLLSRSSTGSETEADV